MKLLKHTVRALSKKRNVERYDVPPPMEPIITTTSEEPRKPKRDFSRWYTFAGLCTVYVGSLILYRSRDDKQLNSAMDVLLEDEQDVKQSTIEGHYRHFALLSENEFNWAILEPYLDGMIFLFHDEVNYLNRSWIALYLSNMIQKKKNYEKIASKIKMETVLKLLNTVGDDTDLVKRLLKFSFQYLKAQKKYKPEAKTDQFEEALMKCGTSKSGQVRSAASRLYPMMDITPEFKAYLEKLNSMELNDYEIKINVEGALGKYWSFKRFLRGVWDPIWGRMMLYTLGGVSTTTLGYYYFVYKSLPETTRWPTAGRRAMITVPLMFGAFAIDSLGSKADKYVFSNYDLNNRETTTYAFLKYFIQLSYLAYGCTHVRYLVPTYFVAQLSQYPSTPHDALSRDGYGYEKTISKYNQ